MEKKPHEHLREAAGHLEKSLEEVEKAVEKYEGSELSENILDNIEEVNEDMIETMREYATNIEVEDDAS
jgi:hypothetical protein